MFNYLILFLVPDTPKTLLKTRNITSADRLDQVQVGSHNFFLYFSGQARILSTLSFMLRIFIELVLKLVTFSAYGNVIYS